MRGLGMAATEAAHSDEGNGISGAPKDGPVLTMMSKRLRALKKKFNRILQIEENKAQGKTINKEQEDVLKTKIAIAALIDEYEKLRQPLLIAVREEVAEREKELMTASLQRQDEEVSVEEGTESDEKVAPVSECELEKEATDVQAEFSAADITRDVHCTDELDEHDGGKEESEVADVMEDYVVESSSSLVVSDVQMGDLLKLLYFAQLFDVRSEGEVPSSVWTKVHERSSCLSYDFVTDDATIPLVEGDLNSLSFFGSLLTTRSPNLTLSHEEALEKCLEHARAYVAGSDVTVSELGISYSRLRERLNRILSSEYMTISPEIQTVNQQTAAAAASAAGQYVTKVLSNEPQVIAGGAPEEDEGSVGYYQQEPLPAQYYQPSEYLSTVPVVLANGIPLTSSLVALANTVPYVPETMGASPDPPQFGSLDEGAQATSAQEIAPEQEHTQPVNVQPSIQVQQHHNHHAHGQGPRGGGGYQNMRGRQGGYGGQGGRGGRYSNGRGRSGRGPGAYSTGGRGGQYFDQGGYYPRHHYGGRGGRRGGGGNVMYNGHANGSTPPGPPPPPPVATGSS